jgi:hypothetical protein
MDEIDDCCSRLLGATIFHLVSRGASRLGQEQPAIEQCPTGRHHADQEHADLAVVFLGDRPLTDYVGTWAE